MQKEIKKTVQFYLSEKKKKNLVLVQARVPLDLRRKAEAKLKKENRTWVELIIAAMKGYIEE